MQVLLLPTYLTWCFKLSQKFCVTFYSKHTTGVCQRRAKAAAAWAQAMFALLSPAPLHLPGNNDGVSSHRATQHCTCHSPVAMGENHLGTGGFEGQSLNMQSARAVGKILACPWFLSLLPLSFQLEIWLEIQAGAGQPRYFTDALCFLLNSIFVETRIHHKHVSTEDDFVKKEIIIIKF